MPFVRFGSPQEVGNRRSSRYPCAFEMHSDCRISQSPSGSWWRRRDLEGSCNNPWPAHMRHGSRGVYKLQQTSYMAPQSRCKLSGRVKVTALT